MNYNVCYLIASLVLEKMANSNDQTNDGLDSWTQASTDDLVNMLRVNPAQMKAYLASLMIEGADEKDIRRAMNRFGNSGTTMWGKIAPMSPCDAINAPIQTTLKGLTVNLARQVIPQAPGHVATPGCWLFVDKFWAGYSKRTYAEISTGTVLILPGSWTVSADNKWESTTPQLPTQIPFGKKSQVRSSSSFTSIYGPYNIPAWMTPPIGTPAGLPPYNDPSWSPKNGYLFNPGTLVPYISPNQQAAASFSAVTVLRNSRDQPQCSEQLSANYSSGRQITSMGSMYITTNGAGTSASGMGAGALVPDVTVPTFTSAMLEAQGTSNSQSQVTMVRTNATTEAEGLRWIQGPNVLKVLAPLEYGLVTGGLGGVANNVWNTIIYPSGMTNGCMGVNYQVPVVSEQDVFSTNVGNGIYDRQGDGFGAVIWISDKFSNVGGTFAQSQQLQAVKCGIAGSTGVANNNVYPQDLFSTIFSTQASIQNVYIPLLNEDAPPQYTFNWACGFGAGTGGSLGQGCHVYVQIGSDDTPSFSFVPFGLGVYGNSQMGNNVANASLSGYGVIPGGMFNTWQTAIDTPIQPNFGSGSFIRQWTYAGTFVCFTAMNNAVQEVSLTVKVPLENTSGIRGPAMVIRVDGVSENQQIVMQNRSNWEVVSTAATKAIQSTGTAALRPMVDQRFPDLIRDLFNSPDADFFKTIFDEESWQERVFKVMTLTPSSFLDLLKTQGFSKYSQHGLHERVTQLLESPKRLREDEEQKNDQIAAIEHKIDMLQDEKNQLTNNVKNIHSGLNNLNHHITQMKEAHAGAQFGASSLYNDKTNADAQFGADAPFDDEANAGGFFGDIWDGIKSVASVATPIVKTIGGQIVRNAVSGMNPMVGDIANAGLTSVGANSVFLDSKNKECLGTGTPNFIPGTNYKIAGAPWITPMIGYLGVPRKKNKVPTPKTTIFMETKIQFEEKHPFWELISVRMADFCLDFNFDFLGKTSISEFVKNYEHIKTVLNQVCLRPSTQLVTGNTPPTDLLYIIPQKGIYVQSKANQSATYAYGNSKQSTCYKEIKTPPGEYSLIYLCHKNSNKCVLLPSSLWHLIARIPTFMLRAQRSASYKKLHNNPEQVFNMAQKQIWEGDNTLYDRATAWWMKHDLPSARHQTAYVLRATTEFMMKNRGEGSFVAFLSSLEVTTKDDPKLHNNVIKYTDNEYRQHLMEDAQQIEGPLKPAAQDAAKTNIDLTDAIDDTPLQGNFGEHYQYAK